MPKTEVLETECQHTNTIATCPVCGHEVDQEIGYCEECQDFVGYEKECLDCGWLI